MDTHNYIYTHYMQYNVIYVYICTYSYFLMCYHEDMCATLWNLYTV